MEVELIEIRDFLAAHPPFDQLDGATLDTLPKALSIRYLRRGTPFPPSDAGGDYLYIVRKGAIELRGPQGELTGKFGEGELLPNGCEDTPTAKGFTATTVEDSLFYLLPCERLRTLRAAHPELDAYFQESLKERLQRAVSAMQGAHGENVRLMTTEVGRLIGRPPVAVDPATTIRDAARRMTEERVSALLIQEGKRLVGILTDRDLRARCVAAGLDHDTPVSRIMTERLVTIAADSAAFEALMLMTRMNLHHLPIVGHGELVGLISDTDLIHFQSTNSLYLVGTIGRAADVAALAEAGRELPELQIQLVQGGGTATHLGQAISSLSDAITQRLVELAQQQLGPAPVPFVWLAVGSQARREQTVHTDQDHALLIDDDYREERHGPWFEAFARFVAEGLQQCGFPLCPGGMMATTPEWRQPFRGWRALFDRWITRPEKRSLMLACNFFDMRPVAGAHPLFERLHAEVLQQTRQNRIFLAHMAANALTHRPPLGFFRNLVLIHDGEHDNTLNLKRQGIIPIVDLARIYALSVGLPQLNTVDRLRSGAGSEVLSQEGAENLEDALEFIATLRARHQVEQLRRGLAADNFVNPEELSSLERTHLKDAFSVIATMQEVLAGRYQTERFF